MSAKEKKIGIPVGIAITHYAGKENVGQNETMRSVQKNTGLNQKEFSFS